MKITDITIGADCEVFVMNKNTREIVSAEGMIKGTKKDPYIFDPSNRYFSTTLDNVLAEFSIPPVTDKQLFYNYLSKSLNFINKTLGKEYCVAIEQAVSLNEKYLQTKQAKEFGCEPDYNAYTWGENDRPQAADKNLRSAGGHIHIGFKDPLFAYTEAKFKGENAIRYNGDSQRCNLVKALDLFLGVPSVIMEPDNQRKQLYGKAGCFRPKEYGIEYRTISNFYLKDRKLVYWVYDSVMAAIDWFNDGGIVNDGLRYYVRQAIDSCDKDAAKELINEFKLKIA